MVSLIDYFHLYNKDEQACMPTLALLRMESLEGS